MGGRRWAPCWRPAACGHMWLTTSNPQFGAVYSHPQPKYSDGLLPHSARPKNKTELLHCWQTKRLAPGWLPVPAWSSLLWPPLLSRCQHKGRQRANVLICKPCSKGAFALHRKGHERAAALA